MANYAERAVTFSWPGAVGAPGGQSLVRKYWPGQYSTPHQTAQIGVPPHHP